MKKQKLNRRDFLRLSAGTAAGTLLAACAPSELQVVEKVVTKEVEKVVTQEVEKVVTPTPPPPESVAVRFISPAGDKYFQATKFSEEHPYVDVEFEQLGNETMEDVILASVAGGDPPELAWLSADNLWEMAQVGALQDITPLMEASPHPEMDQINPLAIEYYNSPAFFPEGQVRVPPGQYGWGGYIVTMVYFYNKRLHDEAGIAYPERGWTWDDFRANLQALTDPANNVWGWVVPALGVQTHFIHTMIWSNGGQVYDENGKCALAAPEAVEALQFMQDLVVKDETTLPPGGAAEGLDWFSGNIAYQTTGMWGIGWFDTALPDPYGVVPQPVKEQETCFVGVDAFGFLTGSANPEAAWEYAKWFTSYDAQHHINELDEVEVISVNQKAAEEAYINEGYEVSDEVREIVLSMPFDPTFARKQPFTPTGPGFDYQDAYEGIWLGDPVEEVMADIAANIDRLNEQATTYG